MMSLAANLSTTTEASIVPNGLDDINSLTKSMPFAHEPQLHRVPWVPPVAVGAQGIYIDLEDGTRIIDGVGGAAVNCIGSGHPKVLQAISEQLQKITYVYNVQLLNQPSQELAKHLISVSEGAFAQCFFVSGGSEAMEAVIKLARQYFWEISQPERRYFIARKQSYHGNCLGTLALSHHPGRRAPYEAILNHDVFHHVSPAYYKRYAREGESEEEYVQRLADEVDAKFQELGPGNVIGFVAEPVVGATQGVTYAPKGYFAAINKICKKYGALLIYDEVMCGMGRMGSTYHAWQNPNSYTDGIPPDIQAVAKGLGGGYGSIGAVLLNRQIADGLRQGSNYLQHGHTYQAHPLAAAASVAVQNVIKADNLLESAEKVGVYLEKRLHESLTSLDAPCAPYIYDIRGGGCFWGIELQIPDSILEGQYFKKERLAGRVQARAMENGLVLMGMSGGVDGKKGEFLMLSPAYNITETEMDELTRRLVKSIMEVLADSKIQNLFKDDRVSMKGIKEM
ncbi:hypothetical protein FRC20_011944 [Serendipita sp. 405]|nr:hypothetical protein FRC20_011944 [Serendipita sp. 405]